MWDVTLEEAYGDEGTIAGREYETYINDRPGTVATITCDTAVEDAENRVVQIIGTSEQTINLYGIYSISTWRTDVNENVPVIVGELIVERTSKQ